MPEDSRYYYDYLHFTNAGAEQVADLLAVELTPILREINAPSGAH